MVTPSALALLHPSASAPFTNIGVSSKQNNVSRIQK
jgi:hypothetical protein